MSKDERGIVKKDQTLSTTTKLESELDVAGAEARETAEIQAAYVMAFKRPRSETLCFEKLGVSCKRPSFAENCEYRFPRGDKEVSGPSVNLAREAARIWQNIRFGVKILRDDEDNRTIRGWALDLEGNAYAEGDDQFKKLIFRKAKGGWIRPDERDLRELTNRRGAILVRNALLSILPKDYIEDAIEQCRETMRAGAVRDKPATVRKMTESFATVGVTVAEIETWLGHKLGDITGDEIIELRGIYKSLADGVAQKAEYFGTKPEADTGKLKEGDLKPGEGTENRGHDDTTLKEEEKKPEEKPTRRSRLF